MQANVPVDSHTVGESTGYEGVGSTGTRLRNCLAEWSLDAVYGPWFPLCHTPLSQSGFGATSSSL